MPFVIFDLDGTLIDSKQDLCDSVNATREHLGLERLPDEMVASFVGNGAPVLIQRAMPEHFTEKQLEEALGYFLGYYRDHMLDTTRDYAGVRKCLEQLHASNVKMAVLTNKPVRFSKDLVKGLGLDAYFIQVYGGNSFEKKKPDPAGVYALVQEAGSTIAETWMVGDSAVDVKTGRNAGVRCVGVTYGLQPESLVDDPPDLLLDTLADLPPHVLKS
jgi:phosphoglycolate phosphatase